MQSGSAPSPREARFTLGMLALLVLAGAILGWNKGQLPRRGEVVSIGSSIKDQTPPDLALYREIIAEVRAGRDYYDVAREKIPQFGFPIHSPLNWRLPTYAWLLALLPGKCWIQLVLLLLGLFALWLTFAAERDRGSLLQAVVTTCLAIGVFRWVLDGQAYLAQEVWAGVLILISVAAHARGQSSICWRLLAVGSGILALLFRELALPYCLVACGIALWDRRWWEAALWSKGLLAFCLLMTWHVLQVRYQVGDAGGSAAAGFAQWLRVGGLDFVLLTGRMNGLLFTVPAAGLWLYLVAALFGLAQRTDSTSRLCCLAALGYAIAFAFVGRPENFYWGLLYAPLLPWGLAAGFGGMTRLWQQARFPSFNAVRATTAERA